MREFKKIRRNFSKSADPKISVQAKLSDYSAFKALIEQHLNLIRDYREYRKTLKSESKSLKQTVLGAISKKEVYERMYEQKNSTKQRNLWNKTEMKLFLKYRAKDGSSVQIWRPECPKA